MSRNLPSRRNIVTALVGCAGTSVLAAGCGGGSSSSGGVSGARTTSVGVSSEGKVATSSSSASTSQAAAYFPADPSKLAWIKGRGPQLDMSGLSLTFDSIFANTDSLSQISTSGGAGPWFAPVHATSGSATFVGPTNIPSPFSIVDDALRIRCEKVNGAWQTGHMQTCDFSGAGFSQQRGYFEIRCKMPTAGTLGAWPAFWLYSRTNYTDTSKTRSEIDVVEYYPGNDPRGHHSTIHLRPGSPQQPGEITQHWYLSCYNGLDELAAGGYHTFGAEVTADWIIIYFDRYELKRIPMSREYDTPLYCLVSMQLLPSEADQAVGPIDLYVDYVRVWQRA